MTANHTSPALGSDDVAEAILASQDEDGAFRSFVRLRGRVIEDRNACVTALVVRALRASCHSPPSPRLDDATDRALDYLERCASDAPGPFSFWPPSSRPAWAPALPPDADDTAIVALELLKAGRRSQDWLGRTALTCLVPFQVTDATEDPAWVQRGAFRTWLAHSRANPVDVVVNTNVAAMLAAADLTGITAYRAVVATLDAAVAWAGTSGARLRALAPFYADPGEWRDALEHAVTIGAAGLQPALREVTRRCGPDRSLDLDRPVCCSAYGTIVWTAPALQLARVGLRESASVRSAWLQPGHNSRLG